MWFPRVGGLLPLASDNTKGLLSDENYKKINTFIFSIGVTGGGHKAWFRIGKFLYNPYRPIQIQMYHGFYSEEKTKYELSLTFHSDSLIYITGNSNSLIGYIKESDGVELFFVVNPAHSISAIVAGGDIINTNHEKSEEEPSDIIYIS